MSALFCFDDWLHKCLVCASSAFLKKRFRAFKWRNTRYFVLMTSWTIASLCKFSVFEIAIQSSEQCYDHLAWKRPSADSEKHFRIFLVFCLKYRKDLKTSNKLLERFWEISLFRLTCCYAFIIYFEIISSWQKPIIPLDTAIRIQNFILQCVRVTFRSSVTNFTQFFGHVILACFHFDELRNQEANFLLVGSETSIFGTDDM